jgi:hypothetical protein
MPKAGETIPPSQEQPKKMPTGGKGATSIEPPAGNLTNAPAAPAVPAELNTPAIPNVPADLNRKEPF